MTRWRGNARTPLKEQTTWTTYDNGVQRDLDGHGRQTGRTRPDHGPHYADLTCDNTTCGATWTGIPDDPCPWCQDAVERQRQWQAQLALTAPDVDRDDRTWDGVMTAWGQRLAVAVAAGLVDRDAARRAWERGAG